MCAEGGTGYNHCVTMGRSRNIWGPYEKDPNGPVVTSNPVETNERNNIDHLKPQYLILILRFKRRDTEVL